MTATFTFAFVAAYLTLGAVVALLLGRMVVLRDRQVPHRTTEVPGGSVVTFEQDVTPEQAEAFRQAFIRASEDRP